MGRRGEAGKGKSIKKYALMFFFVFVCLIPSQALTQVETGKVLKRARLEVEREVVYDSSYRKIAFPQGDVNQQRGVCTDLVVRAFREVDKDLQYLIYRDRIRNPAAYGGGRPDTNIDHRRCRTQLVYMKRHALSLTKDTNEFTKWQPGDIVYWDLSGKNLLHVGVVSDKKNKDGRPLVIHNLGPKPTEDDRLADWKIVGHYRL